MFFLPSDRQRAKRIEKAVNLIQLKLQTIMADIDTLNAKLDEAKQAAADERTETLAAIAEIKSRITSNDLTGAIAKADEVIAAIKAVHGTADDA